MAADEPAPEAARRRVALLLEYDGSRFAGSQLQAEARTVQGVLEDAIEKATGERGRVAFAGRTDAGVHACGQVAAFSTTSRLDEDTLVRALNAWLPEDAVVLEARDVPLTFDPRREAVRRSYRYGIGTRSRVARARRTEPRLHAAGSVRPRWNTRLRGLRVAAGS
jgi:tRNA pseudouridine(38-40) synthase